MDNISDYSIEIESDYFDNDYDEVVENRYSESISTEEETDISFE